MTVDEIPPPKPDFSAPPPYEVATKLPSYEEVQREKTLQGETTHLPRPQLVVRIIDIESRNQTESLIQTLFINFRHFIAFWY